LLLAIHKQLQRVKDPVERLALIKESANIWEGDLRNRFEARDAWRKALELAPGDPEAAAGLARTEQRLSVPHLLSDVPPAPVEGEVEADAPREAAPDPVVPPWEGEPEPGAEPEPEQPMAASEDEASHDVVLATPVPETGVRESGAHTVAGGFAAPSNNDPGEDTKDIDVDVDVLTSEDEIDVSIEPVRSIAPAARSLPPPPPRAALSSLPPGGRPNVVPPKTSRPPPPPGRK
jgi:hypothetical protein